MNNNIKTQIQTKAKNFVSEFESQAKAVAMLRNISEATLINVLKGKWDSISDDMWRSLGKQVGYSNSASWNLAETKDFSTLQLFFSDAKDFSNVYGITGPAGSGKSTIAEYYARVKPNVYHITCADYFNRKMFLNKLLQAMGKENLGYNVAEMMDLVVETLMKQDTPLIILDEADKLNDQVLYFFITLYNMLKGRCGMVLMATDFLSKRITRGVKKNMKGYNEIYSRIGRRFISLHGVSKAEVLKICEANGIDSIVDQNEIYNSCEGDLRRVERSVHKVNVKTKSIKGA